VIINTGFGLLWRRRAAAWRRDSAWGRRVANRTPYWSGPIPAVWGESQSRARLTSRCQILLAVNGIYLIEPDLDELAAKRIYEFAFIVQPLKLRGATGSTVAPAAIR
jgi:kynurenine formamidase